MEQEQVVQASLGNPPDIIEPSQGIIESDDLALITWKTQMRTLLAQQNKVLCDICLELLWESLDPMGDNLKQFVRKSYHDSLLGLMEASCKAGCPLCKLLLTSCYISRFSYRWTDMSELDRKLRSRIDEYTLEKLAKEVVTDRRKASTEANPDDNAQPSLGTIFSDNYKGSGARLAGYYLNFDRRLGGELKVFTHYGGYLRQTIELLDIF